MNLEVEQGCAGRRRIGVTHREGLDEADERLENTLCLLRPVEPGSVTAVDIHVTWQMLIARPRGSVSAYLDLLTHSFSCRLWVWVRVGFGRPCGYRSGVT